MRYELGVDPVRECRSVLERGSKSFALAARFLPPAARDDAAVVYAWCRRVDDAVDEAPPGQAPEALESLQRELEAIYGGYAQGLVPEAMADVVARRGIPRIYLQELLAGMRMDVEGATYEGLDDLLLYAHRVAGVVGLVCCHVLGVGSDAALPRAAHLGWAMQLTNIARDVAEDWERGRLYLPAAWFRELGVEPPAPGGRFPEAMAPVTGRVVARLLRVADGYYRSGDRGLEQLDPRAAFAIDVARRVYAAIGEVLEARGHDVTQGRAVVPPRRKATLVAGALLRIGRGARRTKAPGRVLSFEELRGGPAPS